MKPRTCNHILDFHKEITCLDVSQEMASIHRRIFTGMGLNCLI